MGVKLIINENQYKKVNELIYQTIDDMFDIDQMIVEDVADYETQPIQVTSPDYDTFFRIYMSQYWPEGTYGGMVRKRRSPILQLEKEYDDKLNSLFGPLWHEQMIKWVETNFPFLPKINSIDF